MGTPYSGSVFGSAEAGGNHIFLSVAGYNKDTEYISSEKYHDPINYNPGVLDIWDEELNNSYRGYWNAHYSEYYSHIKFRSTVTIFSIIWRSYANEF